MACMATAPIRSAASRHSADQLRAFGEEVRRLREDAGVSQRALARRIGIGQPELSRVEAGIARPTIATCTAIGLGLGADLSIRLFPNTGPAIRDRHQARIVEALLRLAGGRWRAWPEVGVRHPVRGWIDVVLVERQGPDVIATEVESTIRRLEQQLRWAAAKRDALPSASDWPFGAGGAPRLSNLLVVRSTAGNRALATTFQRTIAAAYPGDPWQALAALSGEAAWPGPAALWAVERGGGSVEIVASTQWSKGR
jgi:transcriptional regulator with XRE-family HTH domain